MKGTNSLSIRLSAVQFAMWELHLYLDTHPDDISALKLHSKYREKYLKLKEEYEAKYGPLTPGSGMPGVRWLKNPWPWDYEGGCR